MSGKKGQEDINKDRMTRWGQHADKFSEKEQKDAQLFRVEDYLLGPDSIEARFIRIQGKVHKVRYGPLALGDLSEVNKIKDAYDRGINVLWRMLQKADPNLTLETVQKMDNDVAKILLSAISSENPLSTSEESSDGSGETPAPSS